MRSPVFIVGSPRSGTSALVDIMLRLGYSGFREGSLMSLITPIGEAVGQHFATYAHNEDALVGNVDRDTLQWRMAQVLAATQSALNRSPWFDKTGNPAMILAVPTLHRLWPDSAFLFAKRRGIENVVSRLSKFPEHDFAFHCADWAANMTAWRSVRERLPAGSFAEVEQQEMLRQPDKVAHDIARVLRLSPGLLPELATALRETRAQETAEGSAWQRLTLSSTGWTLAMIDTFIAACGEELTEYGYTVDECYRVGARV